MKTKIIAIAAASIFTAGVGVHITGHCPLREALKTNTAHVTTPKETKDVLVAKK
jgi:hypothetical protein